MEKANKYAFCATGIPITSAAHVHNIITLYNNDNIVCRYFDRYLIQSLFTFSIYYLLWIVTLTGTLPPPDHVICG